MLATERLPDPCQLRGSGMFLFDGVRLMMDLQFRQIQREDLTVSFERAASAFAAAQREHPGGDAPSALLEQRCRALLAGQLPVPAHWDGAWTFESK